MLLLALTAALVAVNPARAAGREIAAPQASPALAAGYGRLPLQFEPNVGQTDKRVKFITHSNGATLFLTGNQAVLCLTRSTGKRNRFDPRHPMAFKHPEPEKRAISVLRMRIDGASASASTCGMDALPGKVNYFIGRDPKKWHCNIPTYRKASYRDIYNGIDLVYYGSGGRLEYDFVVKPGGDPSKIALSFTGAKSMRVAAGGDLVLGLDGGDVRWLKPVVYQQIAGKRVPVAGAYVLAGIGCVRFAVGVHDASRPLIIDPALAYSTYLGGSSSSGDMTMGIAVDSSGCAYVTGSAYSIDFPVTSGAFQTTLQSSNGDAFVSKLSASGDSLIYSTFLGGSSSDGGYGIAVDGSGSAYVSGTACSPDFPVTSGALQTTRSNTSSNAFVSKLNPSGSSLVYSTYLGGSGNGLSGGDSGTGVAIDGIGCAYLTGQTCSPNFPVTAGAFQTTQSGTNYSAFVSKLNPSGTSLVYSTYLGGSGNGDYAYGIALDGSGCAYVTGVTASPDFPATSGAFQTTNANIVNGNAFVSKLNPSGGSLAYSTYLGGSGGGDAGLCIAIDSSGCAYLVGTTYSGDFPVTPGAFQTTNKNIVNGNAFVSKLSPSGDSLAYSTFLGGSGVNNGDLGDGIAIDSSGCAYVTGIAESADFPVTPGAFETTMPAGSICAAFVSMLSPSGGSLIYSTYLGGSEWDNGAGIAVDGSGCAYVTGITGSANFPVTASAFQKMLNCPDGNSFVTKFNIFTATTLDCSPNPSTFGVPVTFAATVSPSVPDGETVVFFNGGLPIGTAATAGGVASLTASALPVGTYSLTASYPGDANHVPSASALFTQTVNMIATTTAVVSSDPSSIYGDSVTFTATVSPGVPDDEIITFLDGASSIGTGRTSGSTATFTTSSLAAGSHSVTASYPGDASNSASTSSAISQTVNTGVSIASSANPSLSGASVTFTATISPAVPDGE